MIIGNHPDFYDTRVLDFVNNSGTPNEITYTKSNFKIDFDPESNSGSFPADGTDFIFTPAMEGSTYFAAYQLSGIGPVIMETVLRFGGLDQIITHYVHSFFSGLRIWDINVGFDEIIERVIEAPAAGGTVFISQYVGVTERLQSTINYT